MSKKLVAYFSTTGITARVAENLADSVGADLFAIILTTGYTKAGSFILQVVCYNIFCM
ncbi:hypothetical protein NSA48_10100 [Frisingicoccus caecimuris]|uniref:flavodoxin n=1 Tax=Frisingicoccus caecimuris TaxID=1796636 RepID=UPI0010505321|nr:flavodoxin [Frisingicoccus caecimuris]MCR1919383.1 hypothetical protein [Frisingicoccus caecimuris]